MNPLLPPPDSGAFAAFDEMVDGQGRVRPHWRSLLGALSDVRDHAGGLAEACRRLDRLFEDEASALLAAPPADGAGHWRLDPVPLPLPAWEFALLADGLRQRARLLEAVLRDLYGPQSTLAAGLVPPDLVFANAAFLRPVRSEGRPSLGPMLNLYAADLLRRPDGSWCVLADRTSRAAGVGMAQENRLMLARTLPGLFAGQAVRPLRPFLDRWQDTLQRLAPATREHAATALLTSGARHPLWSEHVLLARELSCALVEPGDLTARGGLVFLKTLRGLQPVDVLLRRIEALRLDPLEFGGSEGIPGLMDAWRQGGVAIVNPPGCELAESPLLGPLLPALSQYLLGEPLRLPAAGSHWLADPAALAALRRDPASWLLRAIHGGAEPVGPLGHLSEAQRHRWLLQLEERPRDFVALREPISSVAPAAQGDHLAPRPVLLRMFLLQDGGDWHVMPGGLARVPAIGAVPLGPLPQGGLAKDVWVLSEEGSRIQGPAAMPRPPLVIRRAAGELPSRVADNLFWLGRYVERVEGAARLMRAALNRMERGSLLPREMAELAALSAALRHAGLVAAEDVPTGTTSAALQAALWRALRDKGPIGFDLDEVARLVERLRDRMTDDMHALFLLPLRAVRIQAEARHRGLQGLEDVLAGLLRYSAGVAGAAAENMVRAGGYAFLDLGRRMERAQTIASQLGFALDQPASRAEGGLRLALELCDSVITYRSRYLGVLQAAPALDLVLADPGNPRGLVFQFQAISRLLRDVGGGPEQALLPLVAALEHRVADMPAAVQAAADPDAAAVALAPELAALEREIAALSGAMSRRYFALLPAVQSLGGEWAQPVPGGSSE
ncbi:circularly permuted type 2 ATP-grasp protein [Teichococcus vastitatis]|uniref:Circularly permuted type 2 ATP-grasp protein n=1 Tax=Teichococcus vastitatis TaxID=2307076 RepID=A0ABS9W2F3_9PROT|nr:circularly permuted type 2 ATP-grasp protein [Pseudoroseomonas vastitatis]MCI0752739.1 circularly permuted type 2 ATP-grasp protein [Pseudoroseomonas vastitatis]